MVENYVRVVQMDSRCLWTMIFTEPIVICSEGADRREFGEVEVCCGEKRNETERAYYVF